MSAIGPQQSEPPAPKLPERTDREARTDPAISQVSSDVPRFESQVRSAEAPNKGFVEPPRVERASFQPMVNPAQFAETETPAVTPSRVISSAPFAGSDTPDLPIQASEVPHPEESRNADRISEPKTLVRTIEREKVLYQPLMPEAAHQTGQRIEKPFAASPRRGDKKEFSGGEVKSERQPDEIQIHIGRIEVMATPPAPARIETKPVSRSPNLSDYLKVRHGRLS
jgi:hypothetical protein